MITWNSFRLPWQKLFVEGRRLQDELKGQGRVVIDGHVVPDLVDAAIIETVKVRRHQGVSSSLAWLYYPRSSKSSWKILKLFWASQDHHKHEQERAKAEADRPMLTYFSRNCQLSNPSLGKNNIFDSVALKGSDNCVPIIQSKLGLVVKWARPTKPRLVSRYSSGKKCQYWNCVYL